MPGKRNKLKFSTYIPSNGAKRPVLATFYNLFVVLPRQVVIFLPPEGGGGACPLRPPPLGMRLQFPLHKANPRSSLHTQFPLHKANALHYRRNFHSIKQTLFTTDANPLHYIHTNKANSQKTTLHAHRQAIIL